MQYWWSLFDRTTALEIIKTTNMISEEALCSLFPALGGYQHLNIECPLHAASIRHLGTTGWGVVRHPSRWTLSPLVAAVAFSTSSLIPVVVILGGEGVVTDNIIFSLANGQSR